jgi:hypothetical protein
MTNPIDPIHINHEVKTQSSKYRNPGVEAMPESLGSQGIDISDLLLLGAGGSGGAGSTNPVAPPTTAITDQEFFNQITVVFSPGTGPYGTLIDNGPAGQSVDVIATLPDINGIIDYKINIIPA